MFSYLKPKDGPVIPGLENREIVFAKDQPQYIPLRTLVSDTADHRVLSRWEPTPEQRAAIAQGADIYIQLLTFGQPLQPIIMLVSEDIKEDWQKIALGIGVQVSNG